MPLRFDFASDNTAGLAPEALKTFNEVSQGFARSYGGDVTTIRAADLICEMLQTDVDVRFLFNGTAANAIALSAMARPFESVLAHREAHVCTDEAGAPGFFGQGIALTALAGDAGKIDPLALLSALDRPGDMRHQLPAVLALTQTTELGAVYSTDELRALIAPARERGLGVHVDGARLACAVASGFDLADLARLGVSSLVFGGAKAGAGCVEALVLFDRSLAHRLDNRLKQAGQVASKMRLLTAPLLGILETGAWAEGAAHANRMAQRLAAAVIANTSFTFAHPVASNMVFLNLPAAASAFITELGWAFFLYSPGVGRFVCSWATSAEAVDELAEALKRAADHCQNSKETIG